MAGITESSERDRALGRGRDIWHLFNPVPQETRLGHRQYSVYPYAILPEFSRCRLGQAPYALLGRTVCGVANVTGDASTRSEIDDSSIASAHVWVTRLN